MRARGCVDVRRETGDERRRSCTLGGAAAMQAPRRRRLFPVARTASFELLRSDPRRAVRRGSYVSRLSPPVSRLSSLGTMSPLKRFLLSALLWLPLMFFLWFWFAAPLAWPVIQLAKLALLKGWPQLFTAVSQGADLLDAQGRVLGHPGYLMQLSSSVMVNVAPAGQPAHFGLIEPTVNQMIYGYSLPLFAGLVMATPLSSRQRLAQL